MSMEPLRVGFIGFGEAASRFAKDLGAAGLSGIVAYSPTAANAPTGDPVHTRAAESGVELVKSVRKAYERSTLVMALTPGSAALSARARR